ncbi:hypothetical protein [Eisenbergiella porci]|nr:hypothetical protein [Eisenbergiella porci]
MGRNDEGTVIFFMQPHSLRRFRHIIGAPVAGNRMVDITIRAWT